VKRNEAQTPQIRELFVDELAEVTGGVDPLQKVKETLQDLRDHLMTTYGCGEEIITTC
jgi:hypothetical protein